MASIRQLDTENGDYDLTSQVTVLTHTVPDGPTLCVASVYLGDGVKNLDGSGGDFELEIIVDGNSYDGGVQTKTLGTQVRAFLQSVPFMVRDDDVVLVKVKSPNAADTDVDVTAFLDDMSPLQSDDKGDVLASADTISQSMINLSLQLDAAETAIIAQGDAAWVTATGFSTLTTADVNAEVDTAISDYDPPTKAELDAAVTSLKGADGDTHEDLSDEIAGVLAAIPASVSGSLTVQTVTGGSNSEYTNAEEIVRGSRWPAGSGWTVLTMTKSGGWPADVEDWTWTMRLSSAQAGGSVDLEITADVVSVSGTTLTLKFYATPTQTASLPGSGRQKYYVEIKSVDGSDIVSFYDSFEGYAWVRGSAGSV